MAEYVGVAQGGPRHGVKLMCPSTWDGIVMRPRINSGPLFRYAGKYIWDPDFEAWIWHVDKIKEK